MDVPVSDARGDVRVEARDRILFAPGAHVYVSIKKQSEELVPEICE